MRKERKNNVDKLFLESLAGQQIEPSAGIWESLTTHIPSSGGRGTFLFLISGILIGALTFFMHSNLQTGSDQLATTDQLITEVTPEEKETNDLVDNSQNNEIIVEETVHKQTNQSTGTNSSLGHTPEQPSRSPSPSSTTHTAENASAISVGNIGLELTPSNLYLDKAALRSGQVKTNSTMGIGESKMRESPDPIFNLNIKDTYVNKADVLFGAAFSPAVNIYPEGQNRNDYSLEFVAAYEKSRFILEGGIGANYTSESAKYRINYSTYDSVGFYVGVTSFNVDPLNPDSVIFETSMKNLYDSIDHFRINENTNKFVYLQIPLRIGYRVLELNRFSIDIKAGVLFSLQVYKDIPGVPYQGSDAEQIEVIRQYPDRLTTTWQYTLGIGLNYNINNKVRFTLEPIYRQYIKSVYSPTSEFPASSPYSFGIRGGIYFHF